MVARRNVRIDDNQVLQVANYQASIDGQEVYELKSVELGLKADYDPPERGQARGPFRRYVPRLWIFRRHVSSDPLFRKIAGTKDEALKPRSVMVRGMDANDAVMNSRELQHAVVIDFYEEFSADGHTEVLVLQGEAVVFHEGNE